MMKSGKIVRPSPEARSSDVHHVNGPVRYESGSKAFYVRLDHRRKTEGGSSTLASGNRHVQVTSRSLPSEGTHMLIQDTPVDHVVNYQLSGPTKVFDSIPRGALGFACCFTSLAHQPVMTGMIDLSAA